MESWEMRYPKKYTGWSAPLPPHERTPAAAAAETEAQSQKQAKGFDSKVSRWEKSTEGSFEVSKRKEEKD